MTCNCKDCTCEEVVEEILDEVSTYIDDVLENVILSEAQHEQFIELLISNLENRSNSQE